ncbi:MAG: hypothetical protein IT515_03860 [Burkholderiales bacterium]|nr:hypothetical protein [Burkholderiales bacterium]
MEKPVMRGKIARAMNATLLRSLPGAAAALALAGCYYDVRMVEPAQMPWGQRVVVR